MASAQQGGDQAASATTRVDEMRAAAKLNRETHFSQMRVDNIAEIASCISSETYANYTAKRNFDPLEVPITDWCVVKSSPRRVSGVPFFQHEELYKELETQFPGCKFKFELESFERNDFHVCSTECIDFADTDAVNHHMAMCEQLYRDSFITKVTVLLSEVHFS